MKGAQLAKVLNEQLEAEVARLKTLSTADLLALGHSGKSAIATIDGKQFKIIARSVPIAHRAKGLCVVLVGAQQPRWVGYTHHLRGFVVTDEHSYLDMPQPDLWRYD